MQQRASATSRISTTQWGWRGAHKTPEEKKHWRKNLLKSFTIPGLKMGWGGRLIIHDDPACQLAVWLMWQLVSVAKGRIKQVGDGAPQCGPEGLDSLPRPRRAPQGWDQAGQHWNWACWLFQVSSWRSKWQGRDGSSREKRWKERGQRLLQPRLGPPARPCKAPWGQHRGMEPSQRVPELTWLPRRWQSAAHRGAAWKTPVPGAAPKSCSKIVGSDRAPNANGHESPSPGQAGCWSHIPAFSGGCCWTEN